MSTYLFIRSDTTHPQEQHFLAEYFALRQRAFNSYWGNNLYPDGADAYDKRPDTTFVLRLEDEKVVAGMRVLMHPAHSGRILPMEEKYPEFAAKELLPNHDTASLNYAEFGGLVADPAEEYRTQHVATATFAEACRAVRDHVITCSGQPLDMVIASLSNASLGAVQRGVVETGMQSIVRMDKVRQEKDDRFDTKLWPIVIAAPHFTLPPLDDNTQPLSAARGRTH